MDLIFISVSWLAATGLLCGLALAVAAHFFPVREDPRTLAILAALPGANCGACGYPGCAGYAAAIASGKADANRCAPGGEKSAIAIAKILGNAPPQGYVRKIAVVMCGGARDVAKRGALYDGIVDCAAAAAVAGGDKVCKFGCLGYGTCFRVCPVKAISVTNGLAAIDAARCVGCGKCVAVCPRNLIELVPETARIHVLCKSKDSGAAVRKYCSRGCIGCKICEKIAPESMIVQSNLAAVNYLAPPPREEVADKCPAKCIGRLP